MNCVTLEMGGKLALSCGTGVCATFYALYQENIVKDKCLIKTPGGNI